MRLLFVGLLCLPIAGCTLRQTAVDNLGETTADGCVWVTAQDSRQGVVFGIRSGRTVTRSNDSVFLCCPGDSGPTCAEAEWLRVQPASGVDSPASRTQSPANAGPRTDLK